MRCVLLCQWIASPYRSWIVSITSVRVSVNITSIRNSIGTDPYILVTTQCVSHHSKKRKIPFLEKKKNKPKTKKGTCRHTGTSWVVNFIPFYRFRVIIEFSISLFLFLFLFLFFSTGTGFFFLIPLVLSLSPPPPFAVVSVPIVYNHRSSAGKTFAICHFDRHLLFFFNFLFSYLLTQSTPTSHPFTRLYQAPP